jgi:ABC-2 type transport system permease protein
MGTLMAVLIAGTLLGQLAADWQPAKWLFPTNLALAQYYSGAPPPVDGMTVGHAAGVLVCWATAALALAFAVFARRDVSG